ncbi:MAG: hypothetical protein MI924_17190, partial [Chloroflexales bacterium]|nr:hypothetical protein [Chloroflexales bacterium]
MLLLAAGILTACLSPPLLTPSSISLPSRTAPVVIGFAGRDYTRSVFAPIIAAFNAANPDVQMHDVDSDRLGIDFSNPQIVPMAVSAMGTVRTDEQRFSSYFLNLTPLIAADAAFARDDFLPGVLETLTVGEQMAMLPSDLNVPLLSYNRDRWQAQGLPPPNPNWGWSEVLFHPAAPFLSGHPEQVRFDTPDWQTRLEQTQR